MKDCSDCRYLSPKDKEPHMCTILNKRIYRIDMKPGVSRLPPLMNCPRGIVPKDTINLSINNSRNLNSEVNYILKRNFKEDR